MAICPTKSIRVEGLDYERDFYDIAALREGTGGFFDLIATRRAIRNYTDLPVSRDQLDRIVNAVALAPPGFPPHKISVSVVQDRDTMRKALPAMIDLYDTLTRAIENPIARYFIKRETGIKRYRTMRWHLIPVMRARLPELKAGTEDTITRGAPAMLLFHADEKGEDVRADAMIDAAYAMLAAHALGLGACIVDLIPPAINKKNDLRKLFAIPRTDEVLAAVIVGHPKYVYRRGIRRPLRSVHWI
jgi:nitroreductase